VRIERLDPVTAGEATCAAYADLLASARSAVTPRGLPVSKAYVLNRVRHHSGNLRNHLWVAYDGAAMAGAIEMSWAEAPDNRDRAWVHHDIPPESFSPDLAEALLGAAAAYAASAGRTVLTLEVEAGSPLSAWLRDRGGRPGSLDQHNVLRLAAVSRADVAALADASPSGYEALVLDGPIPDDLVEAYAGLTHSMNDAPRDDLTTEDAVFSAERVRQWEDGVAKRRHGLWTVLARSTATGELAGFNQLVIRTDWPEVVENADTGVARAHRGHGLGLWIKAVNLLRVLDGLPDAVCVETWNAASNEHMLRVNRRLGFVPEHEIEAWELAGVPA
jgi:RimJ/RimL family protein N-acetyltransferase